MDKTSLIPFNEDVKGRQEEREEVSMYRPTVRYDDVFKQYVDDLFRVTDLDRNQIIRGALFAAAHSKEFHRLLEEHKRKDVLLPHPSWQLSDSHYWKEQRLKIKEGGKDVSYDKPRRKSEGTETTGGIIGHGGRKESESNKQHRRLESVKGRSRTLPSERVRIREEGGITIKVHPIS